MSSNQISSSILPKNNDDPLSAVDNLQNNSDTIDNQTEEKVPPLSTWNFIFSPKIPFW